MFGINFGVLVAIAILAFLLFGFVMLVMKFYRKVEQGKALIINKLKEDPDVTFTGGTVIPIIHKAEIMDISVKTIEIDRRGKDGLICMDNIRADIKVTFYVRVNKTKEDVVRVAQSVGCERASDRDTLDELFSAKFSEALKTVGKQLDFVDLYTQREQFRDQIISLIGRDLNGYFLEDAAIDYLEQTPVSSLDEHNILDAQGIRKITELTTGEHVKTNHFENEEVKRIRKQDVERVEAVLELDKQQAEAEAKQEREIRSINAREVAEAKKIEEEERLKHEIARIKTDEEVAVGDENRLREVEVAHKNRERVIGVEAERVIKARDLEAVDRERETELRRIDKDKALEVEKREIANVIRERVAVDKTVAEKEEEIKTLRMVEEANRKREATVIDAEAEAQEGLVKDIKAAEAQEIAATHKAKEKITLADATLEAADREAKAKIRLAEGHQAEEAADGLAHVQVKEADAIAIEKKGRAEAVALEEIALAEARGLMEKAGSMNALDDSSRSHEEYRLEIEKQTELGMEAIETQYKVAQAQAELIQEGLRNAKIDIVGGESIFFDRLVGAISSGKSLDAFIDKSDATSTVLLDYLSGDESLREDLKEILSQPAVSSGDVQNLTVAALLAKLISQADGNGKNKLSQLLAQAKKLGIDGHQIS